MTESEESFLALPAGDYRILSWGPGTGEAVLFLHGLSAVAEVWAPTLEHLPRGRRYVAMDERGHGQSPHGLDLDYSATAFAEDVREVTRKLGSNVHLVGHSMGARVAIVATARWPALFRSVAIIDIGPEASAANIRDTVRGVSARPERFASPEEALAFAFRNRAPTPTDERIFLARLESGADGSLTWRSPVAALSAIVSKQRSRDYWRDWRRLHVPTLYVHGGASNEVSKSIYARMQTANPSVTFEEYEGVGHNIPLIAPERLARTLERHWTESVGS